MKKITFFVLFVSALSVMTGCCSQKIAFGIDGYNHGSKKDIVRIVFKDPVGSQVAPEHLSQLKVYPKTALISNKRMAILTGGKGSLSNLGDHDVEIRPSVDYSSSESNTAIGYGCIVKLDLRIADKVSGVYKDGGSGLDLIGGSALNFPKRRFGNHGVNIDYNALFTTAYKKALDKLVRRVNEIYPVNGTVLTMKVKGEKTEFRLDRGTNYGIVRGTRFHIYYLDPDQNVTWVAIAAGQIGSTNTQATVIHWNMEDPEVAQELFPRIRRRDRTLLGNLFFVCEMPGSPR